MGFPMSVIKKHDRRAHYEWVFDVYHGNDDHFLEGYPPEHAWVSLGTLIFLHLKLLPVFFGQHKPASTRPYMPNTLFRDIHPGGLCESPSRRQSRGMPCLRRADAPPRRHCDRRRGEAVRSQARVRSVRRFNFFLNR